MEENNAIEQHRLKREWLKDPVEASKRSLWKKARSTPIFIDYKGYPLKCTIICSFKKGKRTSVIHCWARQHTNPIKTASRKEVKSIGKVKGTGWQAL